MESEASQTLRASLTAKLDSFEDILDTLHGLDKSKHGTKRKRGANLMPPASEEMHICQESDWQDYHSGGDCEQLR